MNIKNLSNIVEEILTQRDEVALRGNSTLKPEIQFTRQLHETPESYLQRISSEMLKMKELDNNRQDEQRQLSRQNDETVDIAIRAGLLKEYVDQHKINKSIASDTKETRWLLIFSICFITLLLIYLIFLK